MSNTDVLLKAILGVLARQSFPASDLSKAVGGGRQIDAYNLCDGTRTQAQVAIELGIDRGNFSRTVSRWAELGIVVRVTDGKEIRLLHLYPLPVYKSKVED